MQISIHNVTSVKTTDHESGGFIWKKIIVHDDKGNRHEITLFSKEPLVIESDDEVKL